MPAPPILVHRATFRGRAERTRFLYEQFLCQGCGWRVLDVGCHEAPLREMLPGTTYVGVDIAGRPDITLDLEKAERLPFGDREFDTVVCCDVLEHLDGLHRLFGELVRVSAERLVISLPNNWNSARLQIARGRGAIAHYGLPATRPVDRHKWFFSTEEAYEFCRMQSENHPVRFVRCLVNVKERHPLQALALRLASGRRLWYLNRFAHTLWAEFTIVKP